MKKTLLLLTMGFALLISSCGPGSEKGANGVTYNNPQDYNDYIINKQTKIAKNLMAFGNAVNTDPKGTITSLDGYAKETQKDIEDVKGMPVYKGNSELRDAAVALFGFYERLFKEDYKKIAEVRAAAPDNNLTEAQAQEINQVTEKLSADEVTFDNRFQKAQRAFAKEHKMRLLENELQSEIDKQ